MSRIGAAPRAAVSVSKARAEASRKNGAKSRGPRTTAGKARSSRNALKHGLCATKLVVLPEDAVEFRALEAALLAELAPVGALQAVLAQRVVSAAWRLKRADRLEAEVLDFRRYQDRDLGLALMRDGNGTRSIDTVLRYRNAALAEFMRALKTLQALQTDARAGADLPAKLPARRRARALRAGRNEPTKVRRINGLTPEPTTAPPGRKRTVPAPPPTAAPETTATRQSPPEQPLLPAPRRAPHNALDGAGARPTPTPEPNGPEEPRPNKDLVLRGTVASAAP